MITDKNIYDGKPFDRGRISADHARLRGVCPREFYNHILALGLCKNGQTALDHGTRARVLRETSVTRARSGQTREKLFVR